MALLFAFIIGGAVFAGSCIGVIALFDHTVSKAYQEGYRDGYNGKPYSKDYR